MIPLQKVCSKTSPVLQRDVCVSKQCRFTTGSEFPVWKWLHAEGTHWELCGLYNLFLSFFWLCPAHLSFFISFFWVSFSLFSFVCCVHDDRLHASHRLPFIAVYLDTKTPQCISIAINPHHLPPLPPSTSLPPFFPPQAAIYILFSGKSLDYNISTGWQLYKNDWWWLNGDWDAASWSPVASEAHSSVWQRKLFNSHQIFSRLTYCTPAGVKQVWSQSLICYITAITIICTERQRNITQHHSATKHTGVKNKTPVLCLKISTHYVVYL